MDHVLIDTDVILDYFFDREPFSEHATKIFILCETKLLRGYITPVIISNVYYLLRKVAKHEVIIDKLKQLLSLVEVLQMDKNIILQALNSDFKDFEDALQNYSAINKKEINVILTRNTKDFQKSTLAVFSPEIYLKERVSRG